MNYEIAVTNIRSELKTYIQKNHLKSLIIGISGGMDSCLCAALARPVCDKLGIPLIGASLPTRTNEDDEIFRAKLTGLAFCNKFDNESIGFYYEALSNINKVPDPSVDPEEYEKNTKSWIIRNGNIKARIRMIYLYNLASKNKGLVLSTDNYTELLLGFWTLHGDVGDFGMIQNLWKTEVYDMAEWLAENEYKENEEAYKALTLTIKAMATDGLGVSKLGDLGQILPDWTGNSRDGYKEVDRLLEIWINLDNLEYRQKLILEEPLRKHPVIQRHLATDFKRKSPINISRELILK